MTVIRNSGFCLCLLAFCSSSAFAASPAQQLCPEGVPANTTCWSGQDEAGAYYWVAKPSNWNGRLVLHAHGGPALGQPKLARTTEDLLRWSVWLRDGYAWAGSTYRQGGVAVMAAAEDTARLLPIAVQVIGSPDKVILHGQSWGASVAARAAEVGGPLSKVAPKVDAVLLTSGVLGGGTRSYDFRLDLRAVWQAVCGNHPKASEPPYPLWQGLPLDVKLTRKELNQRVDECTGLNLPEALRTPQQRQNLETITRVIRIPDGAIKGHLSWATYHFQDIVFARLQGRNPFDNQNVVYTGSSNDTELNRRVPRYRADPTAVADFGKDADPSGNIALPMVAIRGIDDPIAFVELARTWENTVAQAGRSGNLVQAYTQDAEHSYLSDAQYLAAMQALLSWVDHGQKPDAGTIARQCHALDEKWHPQKECRFLPKYQPAPLESRVPPR